MTSSTRKPRKHRPATPTPRRSAPPAGGDVDAIDRISRDAMPAGDPPAWASPRMTRRDRERQR